MSNFMSKRRGIATIYVLFLVLLLINVEGISVRMVSNTDYCFNCETIYEICKTDESDDLKALDISYYKPDATKTAITDKYVYVLTTETKTESVPVYSTRDVITQITDNKTLVKSDVTTKETYISSYTDVTTEKEVYIKQDITKLDVKTMPECYQIAVRGTLKPGESVDNVLKIGETEYTQYAWWNASFKYTYPIIINESKALIRIDEPIKLNVSSVSCYNANRSDIRVLFNDSVEIPSQILSDNQTLIFVANISAGFNGEWGKIYCYAPVGNANYNTGFSAVFKSSSATRINIGDKDNIVLDFGGGALRNWSSNPGFNVSNSAGFGAWRRSSVLLFYAGAGSCTLSESGSVYAKLNCSEGEISIDYEFYMRNGLYKLTPTKTGSNGFGMFSQIGGGTTISYTGTLSNSYNYNSVYYADNFTTGADAKGFTQEGKLGWYSHKQPYGLFLFFNYTRLYEGSVSMNRSLFVRNTADNTYVCYFTLSSGDCNSVNYADLNVLGMKETRTWAGYTNSSELDVNNTYIEKMYPVIVTLGELTENSILDFNKINIANLTSLNAIIRLINISYNFTNVVNITLYYKTNNSVSDITYFINGSGFKGYFAESCANTSNQALCYIGDNEILPATYNYNETLMESTTHIIIQNLANSNDYYKIRFFNVSNYTYGFYEIMANYSTGDILTYYCNSSYTSGNPKLSDNCVLFGEKPANAPFNHSHSNNSKHHVFIFAVNSTNGQINGVKVTPISYFVIGSTNGLNIYGLAQTSNDLNYQYSTNSGVSWAYDTGVTPDTHLHQFREDTTFYYYGCGNKVSDGSVLCTDIRSDLLELDNLPPTTPELYDVTSKILQNTSIWVNWSNSVDPQSSALNYNLSQYDINGTFISSRITENTTILINMTMALGNYTFGAKSYNALNLFSGESFSNSFSVCAITYNCTSFTLCKSNNISECLIVTDIGCGYEFTGDVSDYDISCAYTPPEITTGELLQNFDLTNQSNVFLFGILIFFWLGLAIVSFIFRNFVFASFMWFVGLILGLIVINLSFILAIAFILLSTLLFMKCAKFK